MEISFQMCGVLSLGIYEYKPNLHLDVLISSIKVSPENVRHFTVNGSNTNIKFHSEISTHRRNDFIYKWINLVKLLDTLID